ncbi:hypothetical protein D3C72_924930 [compost metagenome]
MRIEKIRFSSGATATAEPLCLTPGRITLFIGPNNGGKSQALRDIASRFSGHFNGVVLSDVKVTTFSDSDLETKIEWLSRPKFSNEDPNPDIIPLGRRGNYQLIQKSALKQFATNDLHYHVYAQWFLQHLIINLGGESRLQLTNPVNAEPLRKPATSTMSVVLRSDDIRTSLSNIVFEAFGQHLVIDPTEMSQIQYSLSQSAPSSPDLERSFSEESVKFFEKARPLSVASDGTKAFIGIMSEVMAGDHEVLLIDEPEAFLHPSLAYQLGREISKNLGDHKQLFAATHSPHFMMGCVDSGVDVDIIRLTHTPESSSARSLPKEDLKTITTDPLLKSIGVTSALFYQSAVVCEADSDRAFYSEIASRLQNRRGFKHAAFLNGYGKHTMPRIVEALRSLGIPTVGIMDIDWIKEDGSVVDNYLGGFGIPDGMREAVRSSRREVRKSLEAANQNYKRDGGTSLLSGQEKETALAFLQLTRGYGIFTVSGGELESWLPNLNVSRNKSKWLQEVFFALGSNPSSADYIHPTDDDVWKFIGEIGIWLDNFKR